MRVGGGGFDGSPVIAPHKNPCLNSGDGSSDQARFTSEFFPGVGPKAVGETSGDSELHYCLGKYFLLHFFLRLVVGTLLLNNALN